MIYYNRLGHEIKRDLSMKHMKTCAAWKPFPTKSLEQVVNLIKRGEIE